MVYIYIMASKAEETKKFIVEKAAPIFNKKGFAATSMNDILDVTGLSKGCVYGNFENKDEIHVVTGFIASTVNGETTTLGRNGSNYTASLLANYLDAEEFQNFTHVDGIYTANPELVSDAKKIEKLSSMQERLPY